jgi:hypothetical protein
MVCRCSGECTSHISACDRLVPNLHRSGAHDA